MILVIRIDDTDEPYMMDPKIPKIIVVDDMVMPRKYLRETSQSIVTCSLPLLFILSGKPDQGVFQPSIRIAFYPEVVQVVALPAEKTLQWESNYTQGCGFCGYLTQYPISRNYVLKALFQRFLGKMCKFFPVPIIIPEMSCKKIS
jgi:hypothetical protein